MVTLKNYQQYNVCKDMFFNKIQKRTMMSRAAQTIAKKGTEVTTPVLIKETSHTYASYTVTKTSYSGDESKVNHPGVQKKECENSECNKTNCATDTSKCDRETEKVYSVGHKTNDSKVVAPGKTVLELENDKGSHSNKAKTVIYSEKEQLEDNALYDDLMYKETQVVQTDSNTQKLNATTKDLPEKQHDTNDEK